jgi:hypothetical protein
VSRKTAAEALVHMGQCYEKLGDAESRKAYERVLREYGDQKEAAMVARARLGRNDARQPRGWDHHAAGLARCGWITKVRHLPMDVY